MNIKYVLFHFTLIGYLLCTSFAAMAANENITDALITDLSVEKIDINSGFAGKNVTLFGIQKQKGEIVIVVRGPAVNMILREKGNVAGMWLTKESVTFSDIPGYYAVASNASLPPLAPQDILKHQQIGLDYIQLKPQHGVKFVGKDAELKRLQDAFIQTQQLRGLFVLRTEPITYITDELFKFNLWFPSNIPVGTYTIDAYLFDNKGIIGHHHRDLVIARAGFNASLRNFAHNSPWRYAALTIMIAMLAGWLATVILRRE